MGTWKPSSISERVLNLFSALLMPQETFPALRSKAKCWSLSWRLHWGCSITHLWKPAEVLVSLSYRFFWSVANAEEAFPSTFSHNFSAQRRTKTLQLSGLRAAMQEGIQALITRLKTNFWGITIRTEFSPFSALLCFFVMVISGDTKMQEDGSFLWCSHQKLETTGVKALS